MQFQNNSYENQPKRRRNIIIAISVLVAIILGVLIFSQSKRDPRLNKESYYDEKSGETVSNPEGKSPETFGSTNISGPIFLGFDDLLHVGMSSLQLAAVKQAFINYSNDGNKQLEEVSATIASIKRTGPNRDTGETKDIVTFDVTIDRTQDLKAKVESQSLKVSRLYLYDLSGKLLFDSFEVDAGVAD